MKRLVHDVPRWHVYLHREARDLPAVDKDDVPVRKLEDELFDRLYSGDAEKLAANDASAELVQWAEKLHGVCRELPVFGRLAQECLGDPDAAATAVETLMTALEPHLRANPDQVRPPQLRRTLSQACDKSSEVIEQQRESAEGLSAVGFGDGTARSSAAPGVQARRLCKRLLKDERLARIAALAGRFKRIASAKQKSRVKHGADELADVELGSNIARLLPSEIMQLVHPALRRSLMARLMEQRAMQYRLSGADTLGRGPLVVCLDKSGSMDGKKDIWATAVTLALLEVAQRQKRPLAILAFDGEVKDETHVPVGGRLPEAALFTTCAGGTNITGVLARALSVIEDAGGQLKHSDVVLLTDGESERQDAPVVRAIAKAMGVTIIGLGIDVPAASLAPWCDVVQAVQRLDTVDDAAAEAVFTL